MAVKKGGIMKSLFVFFLVSLCPIVSFADSIEHSVSKKLSSLNVETVQHSGARLKIISNENKVTDSIYRAMIGGICMGYLMEPESLSGITEIQIVNRWDKQGYVFEGGGKECQEYNNLPVTDTKIFILGKTHLL